MACVSNTAGWWVKWTEIWYSWILYHIDLVRFNVILGSFATLVSKWPVSPKRLFVKRNRMKFGTCGHWYHIYGYIRPCRVQCHFGLIRCTCLKMVCISKTAGRRAKQNGIWDAWLLVTHIWGTFDLLVFKVISGHSAHFFSKWPVTPKRLALGQKGMKFETQGH